MTLMTSSVVSIGSVVASTHSTGSAPAGRRGEALVDVRLAVGHEDAPGLWRRRGHGAGPAQALQPAVTLLLFDRCPFAIRRRGRGLLRRLLAGPHPRPDGPQRGAIGA